jgi:hypothetical protein
VAGRRWSIEERIQTGKGLVGLDQHQVRRWRSWYRWATLALLAHVFLVVAAVTQHARHPPPLGLIPLTCNELQHLFATLAAAPVATTGQRLRWCMWRRRHQAAPRPATTAGRPTDREDHEFRLECYPCWRYLAGEMPTSRLKALRKATSES